MKTECYSWLDDGDKQIRHGYLPESNLWYWYSSKQNINTTKIGHVCVKATPVETLATQHHKRHQWWQWLQIVFSLSLSSRIKTLILLIAEHFCNISNWPAPHSSSYPSSRSPSSSGSDRCLRILKQSQMYSISSLLLIRLCKRLISDDHFPFHLAASSNAYCSCTSTLFLKKNSKP